MPELPEVETVARGLRARLPGRLVLRVETSGFKLRAPIPHLGLVRACEGARVVAVRRLGKYLVIDFSRGDALLAHLGMSGHFAFAAAGTPREPHTHAVLFLDGDEELRYVDARRFGVLAVYPASELERSAELRDLGPDPLSPSFTARYLGECAKESCGVAVKSFLLDQRRIAGLGNIYVSEALFVARISPRRRANGLGPRRIVALHQAIREVLAAAVERRGTTFRDYVDADGVGGDNQHHLAVYGREGEPCRGCATPIRRLVQGARSSFFCPRCQR